MSAETFRRPTTGLAPTITVVVAIVAMAVFGGLAVGAPVVMIATGLVWAGALAALARWLRHRPHRPTLANATLVAAALVAGTLNGVSVLDLWISQAILNHAPHTYHTLWQPPLDSVFVPALTILNSTLEWLLIPLALLSNWHLPRRRVLLLAAAACYYAMRVWSYVYFIPQALSWSDTPDGQPFDADMLRTAHQWVDLSFARGAGDLLLFALVLTALAAGGRPKPAPRPTNIRTPDARAGNATLPADR